MEDILNATLAGGVIIGAPSGLFTNPAASLCVGFFGGFVSTVCFKNLGHKLQNTFGIYDTCGVHNLHGIPGILGGIFSAIAVASYATDPITNINQINNL
jgi:ammonium transporter Rh